MAGVEVDLVEVVGVLGVDTTCPHEPQGTVDLGGDLLVGLTLGAGRDELLCPGVDPAEVGEAALGEGAQQVQRRGRLVVGLHETVGRRHPSSLGGCRVVDDVPAERRQVDAADPLERGRARLGELTGDAADLHDGNAQRVGQHDRHLQNDAQLLPDVDRGELLETLSTVAGLKEERVARGDVAECGLE